MLWTALCAPAPAQLILIKNWQFLMVFAHQAKLRMRWLPNLYMLVFLVSRKKEVLNFFNIFELFKIFDLKGFLNLWRMSGSGKPKLSYYSGLKIYCDSTGFRCVLTTFRKI